jgi:hypothetical protein
LDRAITSAKLREVPPKLHLFICVDEANTDLKARNQSLFRDRNWLKEITAPAEESGLDYDYELC